MMLLAPVSAGVFWRMERDCSLLATNAMLSTAVAFVAYTSDGDRTFIFHIGNAAAGDIHYPEHMPENVGIFHVMLRHDALARYG